MVLRIVITVCAAIAFSLVFCCVGVVLGEKADIGTEPSDGGMPTVSSTDTSVSEKEDPRFEFKNVIARKAVTMPVASEDVSLYDTLLVQLTDREGKLKYLSSVSSLLYGSGFSTTLKPISAVINDSRLKASMVSVAFTPFARLNDTKEGAELADACTLALVKELCGSDIDEILLEKADISESLLADVVECVSKYDDIALGVLIPSAVLGEIDSKKEELIRESYSLFDYCVLDLSDIPLGITPSQTETSSADTAEIPPSPSESKQYSELYRLLNENTLLIAKYSLRIRLCATTKEALEAVNSLVDSLNIENYEIVSE